MGKRRIRALTRKVVKMYRVAKGKTSSGRYCKEIMDQKVIRKRPTKILAGPESQSFSRKIR